MIRDRTAAPHLGRLSGGSGRGRGALDPVLQPDPGGSLTEGVVVRTSLVARLLGVRLLRIDGTVLIAPARLDGTVLRAVPAGAVSRWAPGEGLARAGELLEANHRVLRRRA